MFSQASHNSRLSAIAPVPGNPAIIDRVSELIADLTPDDVDLLKGLHRIQHEFAYIPSEAIPLLAERLDTTPAIVYGTIDFYSELRMAPPGQDVVEWCSGPACRLKNSMGIRRALEAELGCVMNQKSIDGHFELRLVQCDGTCDLAPLVRYRGRYLGPLRTSDAINFVRSLTGPASASTQSSTDAGGEPQEQGAPAPGGRDLSYDARETAERPRVPLAPDEDPTREPGE